MTTPVWQPGTLYPNGSLVVPSSAPPPAFVPLPNPSFENATHDEDWTLDAGWTVEAAGGFSGAYCAQFELIGNGYITNDETPDAVPGLSVNVSCMVEQGAADAGDAGARVELVWLDASDVVISVSQGNDINSGAGGAYQKSQVTATAPAGTAKFQVRARAFSNGHSLRVDLFTWAYSYGGVPAGLQFRAVQPATGSSGSSEPAWPTVLGVQVVDNEVIWEAVDLDRVVWEAHPILLSGPTEPTWPEGVGGSVLDNTIIWTAASLQITDENCPHSKVVTILASKVFAGARDITRFCATNNPRDWTSDQDAGFLPTGLQKFGANDVAVLAQYRGNLAVMNSQVYQLWQVDPDPSLMAILDAQPAIGSVHHLAAIQVANDLMYLAALGVRSLSVTGSSQNLKSGATGEPIDVLVQAELAAAAAISEPPIGLFYPGAGQYWVAFNRAEDAMVFVYTMGKWSRYEFPFRIDYWTLRGDDLIIRSGDSVLNVDKTMLVDTKWDLGLSDWVEVPFDGTVWWAYLDNGTPGIDKQLWGFDIAGFGDAEVSFGYNQNNLSLFTEPFGVPADTLYDGPIPYEVVAPSMSVKVVFPGGDAGQAWSLLNLNLYFKD